MKRKRFPVPAALGIFVALLSQSAVSAAVPATCKRLQLNWDADSVPSAAAAKDELASQLTESGFDVTTLAADRSTVILTVQGKLVKSTIAFKARVRSWYEPAAQGTELKEFVIAMSGHERAEDAYADLVAAWATGRKKLASQVAASVAAFANTRKAHVEIESQPLGAQVVILGGTIFDAAKQDPALLSGLITPATLGCLPNDGRVDAKLTLEGYSPTSVTLAADQKVSPKLNKILVAPPIVAKPPEPPEREASLWPYSRLQTLSGGFGALLLLLAVLFRVHRPKLVISATAFGDPKGECQLLRIKFKNVSVSGTRIAEDLVVEVGDGTAGGWTWRGDELGGVGPGKEKSLRLDGKQLTGLAMSSAVTVVVRARYYVPKVPVPMVVTARGAFVLQHIALARASSEIQAQLATVAAEGEAEG